MNFVDKKEKKHVNDSFGIYNIPFAKLVKLDIRRLTKAKYFMCAIMLGQRIAFYHIYLCYYVYFTGNMRLLEYVRSSMIADTSVLKF